MPDPIIAHPYRQRRSHTQINDAPPRAVFELLCPVRELDWVPDWPLLFAYTESGFVESGCVFGTRGADGHPDAVWVVTHHDPDDLTCAMVKVVPGIVVTQLEIALEPHGNAQTRATIAYTHTALGQAGREIVDAHTEAAYNVFMQDWQTALNHYLKSGQMRNA